MPEIFNPDHIDIRHLTIETPKPETRPAFTLKKYVTEADWEKIYEFAEGEAENTDDLFYGGLKTVSPERFQRLATRVDADYYREQLLRFQRYSELLRSRGYTPPSQPARLFIHRLNLQLLFPQLPPCDMPQWLVERARGYASHGQVAILKVVGAALFSDRLAERQGQKFKFPDTYWTNALERTIHEAKQHLHDGTMSLGNLEEAGTWGVATMRLYDESSFKRFMAEIPDYWQAVEDGLGNSCSSRSWNDMFEWAFLAKIIAAHSVSVGPNGLEIQDSPPPSVDNDASILPEQRRY